MQRKALLIGVSCFSKPLQRLHSALSIVEISKAILNHHYRRKGGGAYQKKKKEKKKKKILPSARHT
jgi:hypothetical protein